MRYPLCESLHSEAGHIADVGGGTQGGCDGVPHARALALHPGQGYGARREHHCREVLHRGGGVRGAAAGGGAQTIAAGVDGCHRQAAGGGGLER